MDPLKSALKSLRLSKQIDPSQVQNPSNLKKYEYGPLEDAKSIRLIQFRTTDNSAYKKNQIIELELSIHHLETAPAYACLSYTWGNPTFAYSKGAAQSEQIYNFEFEIKVNNGAILVNRNLYDALKILRQRAKEQEGVEYYWIDAICIDQENLTEKGQQVALMDKIYSTAKLTVIWVGDEDEFTEDAVSVIQEIGKVPLDRHKEVNALHWYDQDSTLKRIGANPRGYKSWLGIIALLNRPYFSRIWIVQEVLLSKAVVLTCGSIELSWELVGNTISFLVTSGWHQYLKVTTFRDLPIVMSRPGVYKAMLEDRNLDLGMPAVYLETTRTGISQVGHLVIFKHLIETFRLSQASNPRDKIYALIGLAWKERPPFSTRPDALTPDYNLEPREVFIKTARLMHLSYSDLRYLCHVEDRSLRRIDGLPSWVPDYTAPMRPSPFYLLCSNKKFSASKGLPVDIDCNNKDLLSPHFRVNGCCLSRITDLARFTPVTDENWSAHVFDFSWSDIFGYIANINDTQLRRMKTGTSRTEIFWRTMCADSAGRKSPAPDDFAKLFLIWLLVFMIEALYRHDNKIKFTKGQLSNTLGSGAWRTAFPAIAKMLADDATKQIALDQLIGDISKVEEFVKLKYAIGPWWSATQDCHNGVRGHFCDNNGWYGMTTQAAGPGDEVWILAGSPVPCVLRPVSGEVEVLEELPGNARKSQKRKKFEFIGEAYIQGAMYGELDDCGLLDKFKHPEKIQKIVLV